MRPPNCFGGNHTFYGIAFCDEARFNEAAELLRRKPLRPIASSGRTDMLQ